MEHGGQWNLRTFDDDGRGFVGGQAIGTPVAMNVESARGMYNAHAAGLKDAGLFGGIVVVLRFTQIACSLIGFVVMAANKETVTVLYDSYYYGYIYLESIYKFSSVKSFVGLLSVDTLVCFYALVQLVICIVHKATKRTFISSPTSGACMLTFVIDTVLALGLAAAAGAAADSAAILGDDEEFCVGTLEKFCGKSNVSVAVSFLALAALALSVVLYPVRLLRATKH